MPLSQLGFVAGPDQCRAACRDEIGGSSVRYELGVFRNDDTEAAAEGYFVHVFVARGKQTPVAIPTPARALLETITI